jgi:mRNA-degrading endonuclease toxin of MazEF toxin-antitoxin module
LRIKPHGETILPNTVAGAHNSNPSKSVTQKYLTTSADLLSQIRAVDRIRLIKRLGAVDDHTLEQVDEAIKISLGLIRL